MLFFLLWWLPGHIKEAEVPLRAGYQTPGTQRTFTTASEGKHGRSGAASGDV